MGEIIKLAFCSGKLLLIVFPKFISCCPSGLINKAQEIKDRKRGMFQLLNWQAELINVGQILLLWYLPSKSGSKL